MISASRLKNTHQGADNVCVEENVSSPRLAVAAVTFEIVVVIFFLLIYSFCSRKRAEGVRGAVQESLPESRHG